MKSSQSTPQKRWAKRSLKQQLLYKFLNEYGYERGALVAEAIVDDILLLIETVYSDRLPPSYTYWPAVPVKNGPTGKSPAIEQLVYVRLKLVTNAEVTLLDDPKLCAQKQARKTFNQTRFVRWCQEAYDQGGVLTLLDLSLLSGLSADQVGRLIGAYEQEQQTTVPIRGTVHDMGPSVTHKAEVIRRFLKGQSPADIAFDLHHSQQAVDTYIEDYEITRKLVQKFPLTAIPTLSRRSLSVVKEHVKLIQEYEPQVQLYEPNDV
jgi:hypothetical protein